MPPVRLVVRVVSSRPTGSCQPDQQIPVGPGTKAMTCPPTATGTMFMPKTVTETEGKKDGPFFVLLRPDRDRAGRRQSRGPQKSFFVSVHDPAALVSVSPARVM